MKRKIFLTCFLIAAMFILGALLSRGQSNKYEKLKEPYPAKAYIIQLSSDPAPVLPSNYEALLPYHFYGICWNGNVDDNLKFVKQMGYKYVNYQYGMENSLLASDLYFFLESPEYMVSQTLGIDNPLIINKNYTSAQIDIYQKYFALKDTISTFPNNIAPGWPRPGTFSVEPDYQQQKVNDYFAGAVISLANNLEKADKNFLFAGLAWDVPEVTGCFYADGKPVSIATWTGNESTAQLRGTTHNYKTYNEGKVAYFNSVKQLAKVQFPGRQLNFIFEPYNYYNWIADIKKLEFSAQSQLFKNAFISQESGKTPWSTGTEFMDDTRIFQSGLITKDHVGSTTPDNHDIINNLTIASKAAINGAWFNWYGRFSGSGDNVTMNNIYEVPNWLQLIRVVANWDNLNGIPLSKRVLNGLHYSSTNSRMDENIIYSRQPGTQKLFVVFLNDSGEIVLKPGEKIISVKRVDGFFFQTVDGTGDLSVRGNNIKLNIK